MPPGGDNWGTFFYFGGGRLAQQRCAKVQHDPGVVTEFPLVPRLRPIGAPPPPYVGPAEIVAGTDCNVWYAVDGEVFERLDPAGGLVGTVNSGETVVMGLHGTLTAGPDGNMWAARTVDGAQQLYRMNAMLNRTALDQTANVGTNEITSVTSGPGNVLWFAAANNTISTLTPEGTYAAKTTGVNPFTLANGPDGNLWFTDGPGKRIGRVPPAGGAPTYFALASEPTWLTAGPDGNIWFVEPLADKIGMLAPATGAITEIPIAPGSGLGVIAAGPDGNVWFAENATNRIVRVTPGGAVTEFPLPGPAGPENQIGGITAGPDGNLWIAETTADKIAPHDAALSRAAPPRPDSRR